MMEWYLFTIGQQMSYTKGPRGGGAPAEGPVGGGRPPRGPVGGGPPAEGPGEAPKDFTKPQQTIQSPNRQY